MMVAGKEIEACIQRLAQNGGPRGGPPFFPVFPLDHVQHSVPIRSIDTGTISANFPTRIPSK